MSGEEEASLKTTPSWAVAAVCSALILIALLIEHALHLLTVFVKRKKRKALNQAVYQIKSELRNIGFMSLLLTIAKQPLSKICIPISLADSFLPCKNSTLHNSSLLDESGTCGNEGKVPLVPAEGIQQLQMLILILAIVHVLSCVLTLGLGEAKMWRWGSWEEETRTLEYQLSHDSRRFMLTRQTSFGKRHLKYWNQLGLGLWLVCFVRQFIDSVPKADYFALRHGFIKVHLAKGKEFDFRKFVQRTLDRDFVTVVRISPWIWAYVIVFIICNGHGFYNHYWLPFIPLVALLGVGTKLETIINKMCSSSSQVLVTTGIICIKPDNEFFWFNQPKLLLHLIQFILIQNSFQLAFFSWSWYKFGLRSCFHKETEDIVLSVGISFLVQILCAYVTLPLYALVTQMGSSMKETIFTEQVVNGLKSWLSTAKENLSKKTQSPRKSSVLAGSLIQSLPSPRAESSLSGSLMQPLPSPRVGSSSSSFRVFRDPQFVYPTGRLELMEMQKVVEEIIECSSSSMPSDREPSFRMWWRQELISPRGEGNNRNFP